MLHVNFKAYSSYVTESLYQWDINQRLNITGLELTTAPEVHFANANMERAIVRESTISNGTITVIIPNSLLQFPLPIKAYIGIYEGETFKVIESVKIPVIPKERPTDYVFVDDGGDIYSYNEILNKMISFENKYGNVDFDVVREYANIVNDLATRITPIESGGTGATTPEEACVNLGVATYQKPWDITENVGSICVNTYRELYVKTYTANDTATESVSFPMINSGDVQLSLRCGYCEAYTVNPTVVVSVNGEIIETFTEENMYDFGYYTQNVYNVGTPHTINLSVNKGDVITITATCTSDYNRNSGSDSQFSCISVGDIHLLANIDTPYKYVNLLSVDNPVSTEDILNALLGV